MLHWYLIIAAVFVNILFVLAKYAVAIVILWFVVRAIKRRLLRSCYHKIKKVVFVKRKDLVRRHDIPTGYTSGYYGGEHYKYEYEHAGVKYRTRVYYGKKFFLIYSFLGTDPIFIKILNDDNIEKNLLPI